jgi:hypothetical protein
MFCIDLGCDALEMSKVFKSLMKGEECAHSKIEMSRFGKDPRIIQVFQSAAEAEFVKTQKF